MTRHYGDASRVTRWRDTYLARCPRIRRSLRAQLHLASSLLSRRSTRREVHPEGQSESEQRMEGDVGLR